MASMASRLISPKRSMASTGKQRLLKALENPTMDPDFRYVLQKFLNTAEPQEEQQQQQQSLVNEQENVMEDVEDDDVEQPSFESFVREINSYARKAERYGVELLIKPKEKSSVNDGHMKNQQPINQHASQTHPQPVENVLMQTPGKSVNRVVKGNVKGSTQGKTVVKVGSGALSESDKPRNVADHRNVFKGKNMIEIDDVVDKRSNQKPGLTKKEVIKKQNERVDFTPSNVKNKVHDERDLRKSATGKNVVRRNQVDQERSTQASDPRNNQLPKKLSERVEKGEAQSQKSLKKPGARTYSVMENHDPQSESTQPLQKGKEETLKKMKKVLKEENESSAEFMASSALLTTKKQLGSNSQVRSSAKGTTSKVQNLDAAESSGVHRKYISQNNQEKVSEDGASSDLEILDIDEAFEGKSTPFVPSKYSIDGEDGSKHSGRPCVRSGYRENVLNTIKKPFDKEEYRNHQEAVQVYFNTYPGLKAELVKYRYNKAKCLVILRGFFFWLQNLTQTGAFEPWTDCECLDVELELQSE